MPNLRWMGFGDLSRRKLPFSAMNWTVFSESFPDLWLFLMAALFIGVTMAFPMGLAGFVGKPCGAVVGEAPGSEATRR